MRGTDELALVIQVACETSDRAPDEQRAMLAVALKVDIDRAKWLTGASTPVRPHLFERVVETYDPSEGRRVKVPKSMESKLARQIERYEEGLAARGGDPDAMERHAADSLDDVTPPPKVDDVEVDDDGPVG